MIRYRCNNCGYSAIETDLEDAGVLCPGCKSHLEVLQAASEIPDRAARQLPVEFTGTAGEYFKIWIVNTFLTVVTFGIYGAWAKVRNRQYFYKNTLLDGHPFEYTANPKSILRGHLIIGLGFALYQLANAYSYVMSIIIALLFAASSPFLVYKSLRFFTRSSAYRNISFGFRGHLSESYRTYLLIALLIPLTLGLIVPYWAFRKKKYFFSNLAYGGTVNAFDGAVRPFYRKYIVTFGLLVAFFIVMSAVTGFFLYPSIKDIAASGSESQKAVASILPFVMVIWMFFAALYFQQEIYAWSSNYCWGHSALGGVRVQSRLKGLRLFRITVTNILAIMISAGLLAPWAKIRRLRYICSAITVITGQELDDFTAAARENEGAYGEAATDFFDIDIGL